MLSLAAKTKGVSYVLSQFEGREAEGVMALLAGSKHLRQGARMSCELEQKSILGKWMGGMEGAMRKAGVWEHWRRDAYPRDVARALWQLSQDAPDMTGIHSDAVKIAEIVHKFQLDAKIQQNRAGAWIGDLKGWMFRQGHDGDKMSRAGFEKWREFVESRLDWPRVLEGMGVEDVARFDRNAFLKRTFDDLRMGNHKRVQPIEVIAPSVGPGNLAKKVSQSRVLHFRDADAGFEYLQAFGPGDGSLVETVMGGFDAASRNVGLMRVLGPNYEGNLIQMMDHIEDAMLGASDKARKKFKQKRKEILDLLHHVDGSLSIPHSQLGAKIWGGLRAQQMTSKLGAALLAQFSDIPTYAANIAHRFDTSLGAGINDAISGLLQGRAKGERLEVLHECAYFFESASHQALARFDMADMTGMMSKLTEMFFKWGGMTWWSEVLRSSAVLTIARRMGEARTKGWDALPNDTREMLGLYKIDAGKWDLMRMASTKEADGQIYLTPEGFHTVSDAALEQYLTAAGRPVTPATVAALRENLADTYRSLIIDQSEFSVLEPGARQRQFMYRGTQRGTVAGDMLRTFYQFKSFPITYLDRVLGREIYGRGYDSFGDYLRNGKMSHFAAFAGFAAALTLCGLFSLQSKQLIKLREMRPLDDARTWAAAFMQGGAIGLYGDFLFGSYNRMGQGMLESLAGPVPSAILGRGGAVPLLYEGAFGVSAPLLGEEDEFEPKDLAAKWLRWGQSNTPFINLHVLRPTLDALIFWRLQEALNPGSMRRMERNLMKESGTRYLVRPSEVVQ
jgi:hypothetical protein